MAQHGRHRNISMVMDLYELTMANGYFLQQDTQPKVAFDVSSARIRREAGFPFSPGWNRF